MKPSEGKFALCRKVRNKIYDDEEDNYYDIEYCNMEDKIINDWTNSLYN